MSPPLTILLLSAICRQAKHDVDLIDTRLFMKRDETEWIVDYDALEQRIAGSDAEVAGISFLSTAVNQGLRIAGICRRHGKTVVAGGLHASVAVDDFLRSGDFDYVIQGEAEEELPRLLEALEQGDQPRFPSTPVVKRALVIHDLSLVPAVRDFSLYAPIFDQFRTSQRGIYVETSRGCVKRCTFCEIAKDSGAAASPYRLIPIETAIESIRHAVTQQNANYILLTDSIATLSKRHFLEFVSAVNNLPGLTIQFNSTVDCWDSDRADACRSVPCTVWFGFETGSQRLLDFMLKGTKVERAYQAARICSEYETRSAFNVLLGIPGETEADYVETLKFFHEFPTAYPNPNLFNPLPGTALYEYCIKHDLVKNSDVIYDIETVKRTGEGPLHQLDYKLVLKYHEKLSALQDERKNYLMP
jgi:anaerobic magnesium-protoporphyrin IX monomethyl ester cyclase